MTIRRWPKRLKADYWESPYSDHRSCFKKGTLNYWHRLYRVSHTWNRKKGRGRQRPGSAITDQHSCLMRTARMSFFKSLILICFTTPLSLMSNWLLHLSYEVDFLRNGRPIAYRFGNKRCSSFLRNWGLFKYSCDRLTKHSCLYPPNDYFVA